MTGDMCFRAKIEGKCMSEYSFCFIIIYLCINIQEARCPFANFSLYGSKRYNEDFPVQRNSLTQIVFILEENCYIVLLPVGFTT